MAKKIITKKQQSILILLYIFRFLNSKQIQEFLIHKDLRRINSWLKDLTKKEYIIREFKPVFGILTKPAVYYLTAKGRAYIKNRYQYHFSHYLRRIARDHKTSKGFKIKCQLLADWYLSFFSSIKVSKVQENNTNTKANSHPITTGIAIADNLITSLTTGDEKEEKIPLNKLQFFTPANFPSWELLDKMKPDGYCRKRTTKGIYQGLQFIIDSYIPKFVLRYMLKRIFTTLSEEDWEDDSILSLDVFLLCPNNKIIIYLKRALPTLMQQEYGSSTLLCFHMATRNQLYAYKQGKTKEIKWLTMTSDDEFDD